MSNPGNATEIEGLVPGVMNQQPVGGGMINTAPAEEAAPAAPLDFDLNGARSAGYSDSAIADFLAQQRGFNIQAARKSGYDDTSIIDFLSPPKVEQPEEEKSGTIMGQLKGLGSGLVEGVGSLISGTGDVTKATGDIGFKGVAEEAPAYLKAFDAIDKGQTPDLGSRDDGTKINSKPIDKYLAATPEQRAQMRSQFSIDAGPNSPNRAIAQQMGDAGNAVSDVGRSVTQAGVEMLTDEERSRWGVKATSMIGGLIPLLGAAATGDLPALMGAGGVQAFGNSYEEAKTKGLSDEDAATAGFVNGAVQGGLMAVPVHTALNVLDKLPAAAKSSVMKAVVEVAKSSGTMMGFSQLATIADNAVAKATGVDPDRDIFKGVGEDLGVQAVVGAVIPVAGAALHVVGAGAKAAIESARSSNKIAEDVMSAGSVDDAIKVAGETASTPDTPTTAAVAAGKDQLDNAFPRAAQQDKLNKLFEGLNTGEVSRKSDDTYEYKTTDQNGDEQTVPLKVWDPDEAASKPVDEGAPETIPPDLANAQRLHYGKMGIDVVYFENDPNIPFDGAVDPAQPNTLFLSNDPQRNAVQVGAHEVTHALENVELPDGKNLADLLHQQVAEGLTQTGREYAEATFGGTAPKRADFGEGPIGDEAHAQAVTAHMISELAADIGGEAPKFDSFFPKVMAEIETRYGKGVLTEVMRKFMDGIEAAMKTIKNFFGSDQAGTISQHLVDNLDKIHDTLAKMYAAKYGEQIENHVASVKPVTNEISRASFLREGKEPAPAPVTDHPLGAGYVEAKTKAATYARWLNELDEQRKAGAEKNPQYALLRQTEAAILRKVGGVETRLTGAASQRLASVRSQMEAIRNPRGDSPDMKMVREAMVREHKRMADLAAVKPRGAKFSPKQEDRRIFYSALTRGIEDVNQTKAPAPQWAALIDNLRTKGVKNDEIKSSGVKEWLAEQKGTVTKEDLVDFLRANEVHIREIMQGGKPLSVKEVLEFHGISSKFFNSLENHERLQLREEAAKGLGQEGRALPTQYDEYVLPGGKNYRELLLTKPGETEFKSSHFRGTPNILAHVRFDDRVGPNGEKVLHIAEVQSDWHQQGRRQGYRQDKATIDALREKAFEARDALMEVHERKIAEVTNGRSKREVLDAGDRETFLKLDKINQDPEYIAAAKAHDDAVEALNKASGGVADAPLKGSWQEFAMKRMLRYAVDHGYDQISWDTGRTNADRYDLSKQVSQIIVDKYPDGDIKVKAYDYDDNKIVNQTVKNEGELAGIIGKEAADRAIDQMSKSNASIKTASLRGLDLQLGGEGMRGFYDKILPDFMSKYLKKWGGKVVDGAVDTRIPDDYQVIKHNGRFHIMNESGWEPTATYATRAEANAEVARLEAESKRNEVTTHTVDITPAMKEGLRSAQPMFSPKIPSKTKDLIDTVPGLKRVLANLTPEEQKVITSRTAEKLVKLFSNLPKPEETAAVAFSGRAKRGWYQHSARALVEVFGTADAPRFAALLAALSPQTSVESNLENALRTWVNWDKAGRPKDHAAIGKILGQSVQGSGGEASVLDAWRGNSIRALIHPDPGSVDFALSGAKVNSFALNLRANVEEVTNDAWMATYAGLEGEALASARKENKIDDIGKSFGFKSPGYLALSAMVREASKVLTRRTGQAWTPAEVQETVWSWAKTLYERRDRAGEDRTTQQILRAADMTHEDVTSTPDFAHLLIGGIYRKILEGGDYGKALADLEASTRGADGAGRPTGPAVSVTRAEGSGFTQPAFERHLQRAAGRLESIRNDRLAAKGIDPRDLAKRAAESEIQANLSAATPSIPGMRQLAEAANAGDQHAARLVNLIAHDSLNRLVSAIPGVRLETTANGGLYGGSLEPSLGVKVVFQDTARKPVLAALARFAENFNQEQIHVRQETIDRPGRVYTDGSYATQVYTIELARPLERAEIERVIADSGLYGLTFNDRRLEAYFVGDPRDETALKEFEDAIVRAKDSLGADGGSVERSTARLWAYGHGEGAAVGYDAIRGDLPRSVAQHTEVPKALAERNLGREVETSEQAPEITGDQRRLQSKIADHYDRLPDNDLDNPNVEKAYTHLATEVRKQFESLPIRVEVWADKDSDGRWHTREGEPYKTSDDMRRDVLDNNHMWIFATTPDTFGPVGADFTDHPLLQESGAKSANGYPLLLNDEFRAVHDYFAHVMSPTTFGPRGEEAAWRNHLATMDDPWARWALTSETRGQNSWVNFGSHVDPASKLSERPFARQKAALLPLEDTLTGNDNLDLPTYELMRELPKSEHAGSMPEEDAFADFSPRLTPDQMDRLAKINPEFAKMFRNPQQTIDAAARNLNHRAPGLDGEASTPASSDAKVTGKTDTAQTGEKKQRQLTMPNPEGKGRTIERGLNGEETRALENQPQVDRARALVDRDPDKAMRIAMRQEQPPKDMLPTMVYFELERRATAAGDTAMIEQLRSSPLAKEVTTAARTVQSFATRDPQSAVAKIQQIESLRETAATNAVAGKYGSLDLAKKAEAAQIENDIKKVTKSIVKAKPMSAWSTFMDEIKCKV